MKILYISCHETLEFHELTLLSQLPNVTVRSIGAYADPRHENLLRPAIPSMKFSQEHMDWIAHFEPDHVLSDEVIEWADKIIFMHLPGHINSSLKQLDKFKGEIYYRSIGQSSDSVEIALATFKRHFGERFKIIRYSPNERYFPNFAGIDYLIRFYCDEEEFEGWIYNKDNPVLLALQAAGERGKFGHFEELANATEGFDRLLIGPRNEGYSHRMRVANPSYEDYKKMLRGVSVFIYGGMIPASYTLTFMEAMMTGVPIISISGEMWADEHAHWSPPSVFEAPLMLTPYCRANTWEETPIKIKEILSNSNDLIAISSQNRSMAKLWFNKNYIKSQWKEMLGL